MANQDLRTRFPAAELKFDDEQLRIIERFGRRKSFADGEVLVEAGARAPNFYVVRSGEVNSVEFSDGNPNIVWKASAGELLGEVGFLSGRASNLSRIAKGDVEACEILPENFRRIIDEESQLGGVILAGLIARTQIMGDLNMTPLRLVGSRFSIDTFRIRDFFTKNRMSFTWIDIESDADVDQLLRSLQIKQEDT